MNEAKEVYAAEKERYCWEWLRSQLLHPRKTTRESATLFEVMSVDVNRDGMILHKPPAYIKILYGL